MKFRAWQERAFSSYYAKNGPDFLCSATPGAGKTTFALEIARRELATGRASRVVIVVPTENLKEQWSLAAATFGIKIDPEFRNNPNWRKEAADYQGVAVTYHQVASSPEFHRALSADRQLVIFDELHHAGEKRTWGTAITSAFEPAYRRLALTGTPFRQDNAPIPFVEYDDNQTCVVDFSYGYGAALADNAVRQIFFPSFECAATWRSGEKTYESVSFADRVPFAEERRRLMTVLDHESDWVRQVVTDADDKLRSIRANGYRIGAGLVVAKDQAHARKIGELIQTITGDKPALALSDDEDASAVINQFKTAGASGPRWIVAVKMVSEGVDIPRLCVGVWATTTLTELFFRQVVGRFVRIDETKAAKDWQGQAGYLYIPRIDWLVDAVSRIQQERQHVLSDEFEVDGDDYQVNLDELSERRGDSPPSDWTPYGATAKEHDWYAPDGRFSRDELSEIRKFIMAAKLDGAQPEIVLQIIRKWEDYGGKAAGHQPIVQAAPIATDGVDVPLHKRKEKERKKLVGLVNFYCQIRDDVGDPIDQRTIYAHLMRMQGVPQSDATLEQLQERVSLLQGWILDAQEASRVDG